MTAATIFWFPDTVVLLLLLLLATEYPDLNFGIGIAVAVSADSMEQAVNNNNGRPTKMTWLQTSGGNNNNTLNNNSNNSSSSDTNQPSPSAAVLITGGDTTTTTSVDPSVGGFLDRARHNVVTVIWVSILVGVAVSLALGCIVLTIVKRFSEHKINEIGEDDPTVVAAANPNPSPAGAGQTIIMEPHPNALRQQQQNVMLETKPDTRIPIFITTSIDATATPPRYSLSSSAGSISELRRGSAMSDAPLHPSSSSLSTLPHNGSAPVWL